MLVLLKFGVDPAIRTTADNRKEWFPVFTIQKVIEDTRMPCRSPQAQKRKYTTYAGKSILLQFSLNDHERAETIHTTDTEKIARKQLEKCYPLISDSTFQREVLNHMYGEILFSLHKVDLTCHGDLSNLTSLTQVKHNHI